MPLTGLILSGGRSSRMGQDKSLISYHGRSQREYLFELLTRFCEQVYTSCKKEADIPEDLSPLFDELPIDSPLNGILTGIIRHPERALLTVPVDMPMINETSISYLLAHRDEKAFATCFYDSEGKYPDPLFGVWEKNSFASLLEFYNSGGISPRKFLIEHPTKLLSPLPQMGLNINTPEDLNQYRREFGDGYS